MNLETKTMSDEEKFEVILLRLQAISLDLQLIRSTQAEHTKILDEHTKILDEHTKILGEHTKILDTHTEQLTDLRDIAKSTVEVVKTLGKRVDRLESDASEEDNDNGKS